MSDQHQEIQEESFRDYLATVDESGNRKWIYPKMPKGKFYHWRKIVSAIVLGLLFIGPFLQWNDKPFLLFNILERRFILFGIPFWPQDLHLFALAMVSLFVFIILFTVVFGRIWCGWLCPQTVFMEMVFRRIEYWIEGSHIQQRKLADMPWNREKILKKGSKWLMFYVIAFLIANTLMAYIVGLDELAKIVTQSPLVNWGKFTFVMIFSGIFFFVFAYFREQACIAVCPYGRLQGVLLDQDSIVVHYDHVRGEPRGKLKARAEQKTGDCIDCKLCVAVCPTGIDIRNGTQMECVNCTACIDACDEIMDKVKRPRGLIRYASYNQVQEGKSKLFTGRVIAYSIVLVGLLSILGFSMAGRADVETTILRTAGTLYTFSDAGNVVNLYNYQLVNKTQQDIPVRFLLTDPAEGKIQVVGELGNLKGQSLLKGVMMVEIPQAALYERKQSIQIEIWSGDQLLDTRRTNFLGPLK